MITLLNHKDLDIAKRMWEVQIPAYRVEAEMIGFADIPPLRDTPETISASGETFIGFMESGALAGFISYELEEGTVDICRMVVHPNYFRRGIAKRLLAYVLDYAAGDRAVSVSTGARNEPAKALYRGFGFVEKEQIEVAPGVSITVFRR
ncbi:GNAT family N-acetyltransferase [Paenibacillus sp. GCM10027627]|uniref:GNAT family N-acetyltransferase n=1 Tax=unclassified Paenibacillus TaxID=185978 RepID=UPI003641197B